ncbi:MAG: DUF934 domain-containing protein [Alphaproteobacteria bacterium]|nr:DUF934 domain-containing protein [Alphaproteobacteria bacterium]
MQYIKNSKISTDEWVHVGPEGELPAQGNLIVPLARWQASRDELLARKAPIGLQLASSEPPELIRDDLGRFDLIALEFPMFKDGRAYSYARLLREQYGFKGELRAVGNVLYDQFSFMHRCGFDAYEVQKDADAQRFATALSEFTVRYQPDPDGSPSAIELRHQPHRNVKSAGSRP